MNIFLVLSLSLALVTITVLRLFKRFQLRALLRYIHQKLGNVYFCSYPLLEVYDRRFFPRFRQFVDWGFCAPVAAMSMLALKGNPTAKIIFAYIDDEDTIHAWTEFRYKGKAYVLDPTWYRSFVIYKHRHLKKHEITKIIKVVKYTEFWNYPISEQFYAKMSSPKTSWLLWELMDIYGFYGSDEATIVFDPTIAICKLSKEDGITLSSAIWHYCPEITISHRIIHQMMQHENATRPKAHTIRAVKSRQKQFEAEYQAWLKERKKKTAVAMSS